MVQWLIVESIDSVLFMVCEALDAKNAVDYQYKGNGNEVLSDLDVHVFIHVKYTFYANRLML